MRAQCDQQYYVQHLATDSKWKPWCMCSTLINEHMSNLLLSLWAALISQWLNLFEACFFRTTMAVLLLSVVLNCVDVVLVLVLRGVGGPKWCCGVVVGPKWCGIEGWWGLLPPRTGAAWPKPSNCSNSGPVGIFVRRGRIPRQRQTRHILAVAFRKKHVVTRQRLYLHLEAVFMIGYWIDIDLECHF